MTGYYGALTKSAEHARRRLPRIPDWCAFYSIAGEIVHIKAPPENAPRNSIKHSIAFCGVQAWDTAKGSRAIPGGSFCGSAMTEELWP